MDYAKESLKRHYDWRGKLSVVPKMTVESREDLSLAYTPGVAQPVAELDLLGGGASDFIRVQGHGAPSPCPFYRQRQGLGPFEGPEVHVDPPLLRQTVEG